MDNLLLNSKRIEIKIEVREAHWRLFNRICQEISTTSERHCGGILSTLMYDFGQSAIGIERRDDILDEIRKEMASEEKIQTAKYSENHHTND